MSKLLHRCKDVVTVVFVKEFSECAKLLYKTWVLIMMPWVISSCCHYLVVHYLGYIFAYKCVTLYSLLIVHILRESPYSNSLIGLQGTLSLPTKVKIYRGYLKSVVCILVSESYCPESFLFLPPQSGVRRIKLPIMCTNTLEWTLVEEILVYGDAISIYL